LKKDEDKQAVAKALSEVLVLTKRHSSKKSVQKRHRSKSSQRLMLIGQSFERKEFKGY